MVDSGRCNAPKSAVAARFPLPWQSIRLHVRELFKVNWPRWVEEKPEWLTPVFIGNVDDDLLPPEVLAQQNQLGGGSRRRSSIGDRMGSVRRRNSSQVAPVEN